MDWQILEPMNKKKWHIDSPVKKVESATNRDTTNQSWEIEILYRIPLINYLYKALSISIFIGQAKNI